MSQKLRVALAPLRSSFINLPTAWASALANLTHSKTHFVFKLSWDNDSRSAYVSWSGGIARPRLQSRVPGAPKEEDLEIDGAYAAAIGLDEGTLVSIEYCRRVPTCTFAEVIPRHYDDWEVIELNAGVVEERLLAQTRLISPNQPIVFWLNASTSIVLNATQIMPDVPVALLDNDSEIAVAPRRRTAINVDTSRLVGTRDETD
ncbi:Peroxisome biosynthesis protein pex1, partial [Spiromyces aspiralis]